MSKVLQLIALTLAIAALAACSNGGGGASSTDTPAAAISTTPSANTTPLATQAAVIPSAETAAVQAVKDDLLGRLAVTADDIKVVSINPQDWPDACLGAGTGGETCATVITPGYEIVVSVNETSYTYRTDTAGATVRPAGVHIDTGSN